MKKKICHIITRFLNGGAEENTVLTCNYSAKLGDSVTLITGVDTDKEIISKLDKRVKLIKIKSLIRNINPIKDFLAFIEVTRNFKKIKPDIVHTHESKAGIIGRICAKIAGVKLIIHSVHILPFINVSYFKKIFYLFFEKITSYITDHFICVSRGMLEESLKHNISKIKKYKVIHSGFDIKKFKKARKNYNLVKIKAYKANPGIHTLILMVGAFEERKRQIEFLHIFKRLTYENKKLILVFVGSGKLLNEAKKKSTELNLIKQVYFAGFRDDPERYVVLSDICVMNSIREGLPRVVPQYLACGKPVVSSDLPGIREILKNSKNGFIFNKDNQEELYNKLNLLLKNKKLLRNLTIGAKKTDISKWSQITMPIKINNLYNRLLKNS